MTTEQARTKLKYFMDTEFIEDGKTIDLISIGIVCEDGRELYCQNLDCDLTKASPWVVDNVFPGLTNLDVKTLDMQTSGLRMHRMTINHTFAKLGDWWLPHNLIRDRVQRFLGGSDFYTMEPRFKPEIWGWYSDYDWVAFCQLWGKMIDLPRWMPKYCRDLKQWESDLGGVELPKQDNEHNALADARWNRSVYDHLAAQVWADARNEAAEREQILREQIIGETQAGSCVNRSTTSGCVYPHCVQFDADHTCREDGVLGRTFIN